MKKQFRIRPDFILRYRRKNYSCDEISQAVSYWLNIINQFDKDKIIGITFASLSFSGVCCLLALYKSGRSFRHLGVMGREINDQKRAEENLSAIIVIGEVLNSGLELSYIHNEILVTDNWEHAVSYCLHNSKEELVFDFTDSQYIEGYTSGSTGRPTRTKMTTYLESLSIEIAMNLFFKEDDYCVFSHGMSHMGVHSTAILPGIFKAKTVSLADYTWDEEIEKATHIQFFTTMSSFLKLPKKLRVITTGGNSLKQTFLETIQNQCDYDSLYDIYGLTECLPPLAVRNIKIKEDLSKPFKWINKFYKVSTVGNRIQITRPDGEVFLTSDTGIVNQDQLTFQGRALKMLRVNGNLLSIEEFKEQFEKTTGILDYVIEYKNEEFILHGLESDSSRILLFIQDHIVNLIPKFYENLDTNGGIKNIS